MGCDEKFNLDLEIDGFKQFLKQEYNLDLDVENLNEFLVQEGKEFIEFMDGNNADLTEILSGKDELSDIEDDEELIKLLELDVEADEELIKLSVLDFDDFPEITDIPVKDWKFISKNKADGI